MKVCDDWTYISACQAIFKSIESILKKKFTKSNNLSTTTGV